MTNKEIEQIRKWAIEKKIVIVFSKCAQLDHSYCNILNSYLKQDEPMIAIVNSIAAYCHESSKTEVTLLSMYVFNMLISDNSALGDYLRNVKRHTNNIVSGTKYFDIVKNAVKCVKTEKENV